MSSRRSHFSNYFNQGSQGITTKKTGNLLSNLTDPSCVLLSLHNEPFTLNFLLRVRTGTEPKETVFLSKWIFELKPKKYRFISIQKEKKSHLKYLFLSFTSLCNPSKAEERAILQLVTLF